MRELVPNGGPYGQGFKGQRNDSGQSASGRLARRARPRAWTEYVTGIGSPQPYSGGESSGQLSDSEQRPSEEDIQRVELGPRGEPGKFAILAAIIVALMIAVSFVGMNAQHAKDAKTEHGGQVKPNEAPLHEKDLGKAPVRLN